jgi:hypothetical protein
MSCNDIVRHREQGRDGVPVLSGGGPGELPSCSGSPSFFSQLSNEELGRAAAFHSAHAECVYFQRFSSCYEEIHADCYTCDVSREI